MVLDFVFVLVLVLDLDLVLDQERAGSRLVPWTCGQQA
jgi:hypothetical protein